jgi:hypothetical protein
MKKDTTKYTDRQKETLSDIARQLEMALGSDKTPKGVKDCLETIIFEASSEAGLPLSDFTLIRSAFPKIIEALPTDYGRGIYHSIHSILIQDTSAFKDFYEQRLDVESEKETDAERRARLDRERQPYVDLLKSLDDEETARKFKERQIARAKDLIGDILSVTTGNSIVEGTNQEWGHACLLELMEILQIRHKNFYIPDFISNLENYIFKWTMTYGESYSTWKKKAFAQRGLDAYGVELNK